MHCHGLQATSRPGFQGSLPSRLTHSEAAHQTHPCNYRTLNTLSPPPHPPHTHTIHWKVPRPPVMGPAWCAMRDSPKSASLTALASRAEPCSSRLPARGGGWASVEKREGCVPCC